MPRRLQPARLGSVTTWCGYRAAQWGGSLPAALVDDAGRRVPVQVSGDELLFVAKDLPALGVRTYRPSVEPAGAGADGAPVVATDAENVLDNGLLRLRVHPASGAIDQLIDWAARRDLAGPWAGQGAERKINAGMVNRLQIVWEQPHPMSAWNIGDNTRIDNLITGAEVRVVESGPVRGVYRSAAAGAAFDVQPTHRALPRLAAHRL